ncbi:hypothetical protein FEZ51_08565 [Pediococcus stilesii]|uniref:DUF806 family protein n=1 Tax=Pediococcus stilesii TaxID=331679 RepID=A0A5R9BSE5_9LACO|nr:hypothetical protein [Pediococcus stilesii]TLQ03648.1 hypothetical protein FEZ51_08565 [Pediococcus stilesii]
MTPSNFVLNVLSENLTEIPEISVEHIHTFFIPETETATDVPILVISDLPVIREDYGNDNPVDTVKGVQIIIYYPQKYFDGDMESIESRIKSTLLKNRIRCFSDAGHVITPDTQNIINTLKFNYVKEAN